MREALLYGMRGLLLALLSCAFYYLRAYLAQNKVWKKYGDWLEEKRRARLLEEDDLQRTEGAREKLDFMRRLDLMILHSHLDRALPFMSSEIFLMWNVASSAVAGILGAVIGRRWEMGALLFLLAWVLPYAYLYVATLVNHQRLEGNILTFMNLLENYSKTNDDILKIFGQTEPFLDEPLRSYIRDFYFEAIHDGDATRAFHNLETRVGHEKLQEIIHNIEICSRHEANYEDIIKDNRLSLNEYLSVREEKKAIVNNGRVEILMLLGASGVCLGIFGGLVNDMKGVMLGTFGGNVLLGFCAAILLYCVWVMTSLERR